MAYVHTPDGLRQEVRRSTASSLVFRPRVTGVGPVTASSASFVVLDPSGVELQALTSASISGTSVTCAIPAISTLAEDYQLVITWAYSGVTYVSPIMFDVVMYPFGSIQIGLDQLSEERPDISEILTRMGALVSKSAEEMASIFAYRARIEVDRLVRDAIPSDQGRPTLILNQERLMLLERKLAMKLIFASEMSGPDGEDESSSMFRYYRDDADSAWRSIGPLKFADPGTTTPIAADIKITPGRVRHLRRG